MEQEKTSLPYLNDRPCVLKSKTENKYYFHKTGRGTECVESHATALLPFFDSPYKPKPRIRPECEETR